MTRRTKQTATVFALTSLLALASAPAADTFPATDLGSAHSIDILADGSIPAVGDNWGTVTSNFRIYQQNGTPSCPLTPLNSNPTATFNIRPAITVAGSNALVAVWDQNSSIHGQRFTTAGTAIGAPFQINTRTDSENSPVVAANTSGQFLVIWTYNSFGSSIGRLRYYNADGTADGTPSAFYATDPSRIQLMLRDDRRAHAIWQHTDSWAARYWITGSHLRDDGYSLHSFVVDQTEAGDGSYVSPPSAEADSIGRFVVAWRRRDPDQNDRVLAREYDENAIPIGPVYTLSDTASNAGNPQVAVDANGRAIVAWTSDADGQLHYTTFLIARSHPSPPLPLTNGVSSIQLSDLAINTSGQAAASWYAGGGVSNITTFQNGASATIDPGPAFDAWLTRNFPDPTVAEAAPNADPDRDNLPNLVEYKLGLPPRYFSSLPLPTYDGNVFNWRLPLNPTAINATLQVQASTTLGADSWSSSGVILNTGSEGSTAATAFVFTSGSNAIFLRAHVVLTDEQGFASQTGNPLAK